MNREHIIKGLMDALECTEDCARKKLRAFEYTLRETPEMPEYNEEVNRHDGWYRKFEKQNKRK